MPLFFQQDIDADTKLAIWKIGEEERFFSATVPLSKDITHPHKRLQHLAGRYLLKYLFPDFPLDLILIADTNKPFLKDEAYHFSISHCGQYAAALVSKSKRVGVDIEIPTTKVERIKHKFLSTGDMIMLQKWNTDIKESSVGTPAGELDVLMLQNITLLWSAKESMFKWWGNGGIDFSEMLKLQSDYVLNEGNMNGRFENALINNSFPVYYKIFNELVLAWVTTPPK